MRKSLAASPWLVAALVAGTTVGCDTGAGGESHASAEADSAPAPRPENPDDEELSDDPFAGLNLGPKGEGGSLEEPELDQEEWAYKDQYKVVRYEDGDQGEGEGEGEARAETSKNGQPLSRGDKGQLLTDDEMFALEEQRPPKDAKPPPGFKKPNIEFKGDIKKAPTGKAPVVDPWRGEKPPEHPPPDPDLHKLSPAARLHGREPTE